MSDLPAVQQALQQRFEAQRVVFWHDPAREYEAELETLDLAGVNTIKVDGNEFGVKSAILADHTTKHLVYRTGEVPHGTGNWLLDLELAYGVFTADRASMIQQELKLNDRALLPVIQEHKKFFASNVRKQALVKLLSESDDAIIFRAKMCQVLTKAEGHKLTDIVREILKENAEHKDAKYAELVTHGLDSFFWEGLANIYGYKSEAPSVEDFVLWMFSLAIEDFKAVSTDEYRNIRSDFDALRYDLRTQASMTKLAGNAASVLDVGSRLEDRSYRELLNVTIFEEIDQKTIRDLTDDIIAQSITVREVRESIRKRQGSPWYDKYDKFYAALLHASELFSALGKLPRSIASMAVGLESYTSDWYRIDQHYRKFVYAFRTAEVQDPLERLKQEVDRQYTNKYLYEFGALWQQTLEPMTTWTSNALTPQASFFESHVDPIVKDGRSKAVVIISDAMRYEIADELVSRIRSRDRFDASLSAMLGSLPSYTQLGMAALLPHNQLELSPEGLPVFADGVPTNGTKNRNKILESVKGCALSAADVQTMSALELRELYKQHQVFYVYHDRIDAAGDDAASERTVFEAAEETLRELVGLVTKWTSANATNILITADHGFQYQDVPLEEAYYLSERPNGAEITKKNRRFVLGRALEPSPALMTFTSAALGLSGDIDVQIPKSIHRIPLPGAGTRFVHGGASLQEIVVPVVAVNKKRKSDTRQVDVAIWPETDKITTGQLSVKLMQSEPVTDKIHARTVRVGLYAGDVLISGQPILTFDSTSDDQRDRYQIVQLFLTQEAEDFNHRLVELRLEDPIPNTTRWKPFARANYMIKRSFTTDFDF